MIWTDGLACIFGLDRWLARCFLGTRLEVDMFVGLGLRVLGC